MTLPYDPAVRAEIARKELAEIGNDSMPLELDFAELADSVVDELPTISPARPARSLLPSLHDAREEAALQLAQLPDYKDNRDVAISDGQLFDDTLKSMMTGGTPEERIAAVECKTRIYCEHLKLRGAMAKALTTPKTISDKRKVNLFMLPKGPSETRGGGTDRRPQE